MPTLKPSPSAPNSHESSPAPFESGQAAEYVLGIKTVAARLHVAVSTLNGWLREDYRRPEAFRLFEFHRWRGKNRFWSEKSFLRLEMAIHCESQHGGVLAGSRSRTSNSRASAPDPDAEASLEKVLGRRVPRM
jgi:hypothetical protein